MTILKLNLFAYLRFILRQYYPECPLVWWAAGQNILLKNACKIIARIFAAPGGHFALASLFLTLLTKLISCKISSFAFYLKKSLQLLIIFDKHTKKNANNRANTKIDVQKAVWHPLWTLISIGWMVGWLVGLSAVSVCHNFQKWREVFKCFGKEISKSQNDYYASSTKKKLIPCMTQNWLHT